MDVKGVSPGVRYSLMCRVAETVKDAELLVASEGLFNAHLKMAEIRDSLKDQYLDVDLSVGVMDEAILSLAKLGL